ncbi:hypothetical protein BC826DRAFT_981945 [Russula brevipes]|nr:hypothetical protein BC826DRAFT_981945 [Russula brevipes]
MILCNLLSSTKPPPPSPPQSSLSSRSFSLTSPRSNNLLSPTASHMQISLHPPNTTYSRVRLEKLLDEPGALERPDVWDAGLNKTQNFLPLRAVVKILYAGWRRDGTWPDKATVVDDDNFFGATEPQANGEPAMSGATSSLAGGNPPC